MEIKGSIDLQSNPTVVTEPAVVGQEAEHKDSEPNVSAHCFCKAFSGKWFLEIFLIPHCFLFSFSSTSHGPRIYFCYSQLILAMP